MAVKRLRERCPRRARLGCPCMGNTSFIVLRTARGDVLGAGEPRTQFAELTGAYWLEPIYAGLANEWNRQGRTVPGAPREHRRVLPDGSFGPDGPDTPDEPHTAEPPEERGDPGPGPGHDALPLRGPHLSALGDGGRAPALADSGPALSLTDGGPVSALGDGRPAPLGADAGE